jgi:hypothetical protein
MLRSIFSTVSSLMNKAKVTGVSYLALNVQNKEVTLPSVLEDWASP